MEEKIINSTIMAMKSILNTRFYQTERGYQGRFYYALQIALDNCGFLNDEIILEMEYQKSSRHGLSQRPDIVIHTPAELQRFNVKKGNYAVFAIKRKATLLRAMEDYDKLDEMFEHLHYCMGLFINIDSDKDYLEEYSGRHKEKIQSFSVKLVSDEVLVTHTSWVGNVIRNIQI